MVSKKQKMRTILMSIKARHNRNIESGLKISELRLKLPTCALPFKVLTVGTKW